MVCMSIKKRAFCPLQSLEGRSNLRHWFHSSYFQRLSDDVFSTMAWIEITHAPFLAYMSQKKIWFWSTGSILTFLADKLLSKCKVVAQGFEVRDIHEIAEMVQVIKKYREGGHLVGRRKKKPWTSWGDDGNSSFWHATL